MCQAPSCLILLKSLKPQNTPGWHENEAILNVASLNDRSCLLSSYCQRRGSFSLSKVNSSPCMSDTPHDALLPQGPHTLLPLTLFLSYILNSTPLFTVISLLSIEYTQDFLIKKKISLNSYSYCYFNDYLISHHLCKDEMLGRVSFLYPALEITHHFP